MLGGWLLGRNSRFCGGAFHETTGQFREHLSSQAAPTATAAGQIQRTKGKRVNLEPRHHAGAHDVANVGVVHAAAVGLSMLLHSLSRLRGASP